jgi:hypothetical protein
MSVTSVGGGPGWGVKIFTLIHFNTPFRSCFTKYREKNVTSTIKISIASIDCDAFLTTKYIGKAVPDHLNDD